MTTKEFSDHCDLTVQNAKLAKGVCYSWNDRMHHLRWLFWRSPVKSVLINMPSVAKMDKNTVQLNKDAEGKPVLVQSFLPGIKQQSEWNAKVRRVLDALCHYSYVQSGGKVSEK
jgi:hypothetical protein